MAEFGFPEKLIMEDMQYRVRMDNTVLAPFSVKIGL